MLDIKSLFIPNSVSRSWQSTEVQRMLSFPRSKTNCDARFFAKHSAALVVFICPTFSCSSCLVLCPAAYGTKCTRAVRKSLGTVTWLTTMILFQELGSNNFVLHQHSKDVFCSLAVRIFELHKACPKICFLNDTFFFTAQCISSFNFWSWKTHVFA